MKTPGLSERHKKSRLIQVARINYRSPSFEKERKTIIRRLPRKGRSLSLSLSLSPSLRLSRLGVCKMRTCIVARLFNAFYDSFSRSATPSRPRSKTRQQDERLPDWSAYRDSIKSLIINYAGECSAYLSVGPFASVDRGLCRTTSTPLALTLAFTDPQYRGCLSFGLYADRSRANRIPR